MQQARTALLARDARQAAALVKVYGRIWRNLRREIDDLMDLLAAGRDLPYARERAQALARQIEAEVSRYAAYADGQLEAGIVDGIKAASRDAPTIVRAGFPVQGDAIMRALWTRLPVEAVENALGMFGEGSPLHGRMTARLGPAVAEKVAQQLLEGIALGRNPRQTQDLLRQTFGQGLDWSLTATRTAHVWAYREAARANYAVNERIVRGWVWRSAKDGRACMSCIALDGTQHPNSEVLADHYNGRCWPEPLLVTYEELGIKGPTPPEEETGAEWFRRQPEAKQRAMMGDTAWDEWEAGKFDLRDYTRVRNDEVYGGMMQEATLRELLSRTGMRPVWSPLPPPLPSLTVVAPKAELWPMELDKLERVRSLGGSTGAELVRDPASGRLFVIKRGRDEGHLREEAWADAAYRALGVNVPEFRVYETAQGPVKLAAFVEGKSLQEYRKTATPAQLAAVRKKLQKGFAADCLLGNWDVVGLDYDNILIDQRGQVWRIDNGGALRRRAQGALKSGWDEYVTELWTLRDAAVNQQTAWAFGDMDFYDVARQAQGLGRKRKALLAVLPDDLKEVVGKRLDLMLDVAKTARTFEDDKWVSAYVDGFARQSVELRRAGIAKLFPQQLKQHNQVEVVDEQGKWFDKLRGPQSVIQRFADYVNGSGGRYDIISDWMSGQAGSSWSSQSQAYKWYLSQQMGVPLDSYYWQDGPDAARKLYQKYVQRVGEDTYRRTMQAWHAFNYEFLRATKFKYNDHLRRLVELVRTESRQVMQASGFKRGDTGLRIVRGVAESTSVFRATSVAGGEQTVQLVPWHRIVGMYFFERYPGAGHCGLYGDRENEFVALLYNILFDYRRR